MRRASSEEVAFAARGLRDGTLFLRDIVGLTDAEVAALVEAAETQRRRGRLAEASAIYGALISFEPTHAAHWRAMAALQRAMGQHAAAAGCFEALALLEGRDAERTRQQALCLQQLGLEEPARDLLQVAVMIERGGEHASQ